MSERDRFRTRIERGREILKKQSTAIFVGGAGETSDPYGATNGAPPSMRSEGDSEVAAIDAYRTWAQTRIVAGQSIEILRVIEKSGDSLSRVGARHCFLDFLDHR